MSKLRPLGNRVILQPLKRRTKGDVIIAAPRYMDDHTQWVVLQVGLAVPEEIKPGAQVLTESVFEPDHEFTDGVVIVKSNVIKAVFYE